MKRQTFSEIFSWSLRLKIAFEDKVLALFDSKIRYKIQQFPSSMRTYFRPNSYRISSRPAGIIISHSHSLQMRVLLEKTIFSLHKIVRNAGIIRGRVLYEEIRYLTFQQCTKI